MIKPTTGAKGHGATQKIARYAATLRYEALPSNLIELIKQCILDNLGVIMAASTLAPEAKIVADYVKELGGKPESTVLGFGGKAPACWAAFVNGSLGHMLDYDDIGAGHVSSATVPVACAIAEKLGGVSGRDLITAIAGGTDIMVRLCQSIDIPDWTIAEGWFTTQLLGFICGAATAGRLLNLDEECMENALGIGFNQLSGSRQMAIGTASHMRSMQAGFSSQGATLSAELARRGITGPKEILEGRYGLFKTYIRTDNPNWEAIVGGLGTRFPLIDKHGFKIWPACGYTRHSNTATLKLREEFNLTAEDVESIIVIGGSGAMRLLSEPLELKRRPQSSIDGKYSIPFTTAVMMVKGTISLRDYTDEGLHDPVVLAMADKISYRADDENPIPVGGDSSVSRPTVEIRAKDGRVLSCCPDVVPGDPKLPVEQQSLETKFRDCASFSAKAIPVSNLDRAIDMIRNLEKVPDVTAIMGLLA